MSINNPTDKFWHLLILISILVAGYIAISFPGTIILGLFFYYVTRPFYRMILQEVYQPTLAAITAISIITLPFVLLLIYTLSIAFRELLKIESELDLQSVNEFLGDSIQIPTLDMLSNALVSPEQIAIDGINEEVINSILEAGIQSIELLFSVSLRLLIMFIFVFYLLRDGHKIVYYLRSNMQFEGSIIEEYMIEVDYDLHKVFFGNLLNAVVTGLIAAIVFSIIEAFVPTPELSLTYPVLLGILCGAASLIPVVGMKLVYIPVTAYLGARVFYNSGTEYIWFPILFVGVSFVIVDSIPDFFLRPYISGRNLHIGSLMLAYILGPLVFGWYGLFLGPTLLVVFFELYRIVIPQITKNPHKALPSSENKDAPNTEEEKEE